MGKWAEILIKAIKMEEVYVTIWGCNGAWAIVLLPVLKSASNEMRLDAHSKPSLQTVILMLQQHRLAPGSGL